MATETVEERLQRIEDIEAIRLLKHRYCAFCDDNYDADGIASLFTENAVWDAGLFGRNEGREAIREYFRGTPDNISFAIHQVSNSAIEVDGDSAEGSWYLWQPMVMRDENRALWLAARYDELYLRQDGNWLIHDCKVQVRMLSPYEKGFGQERVTEL